MKSVVSLFDESGNALRPWAEAGYHCYAFDIQNTGRVEYFPSGGRIEYRYADLLNPEVLETVRVLSPCLIMGFPPCTDMAVSGARHFAAKRAKNPSFQNEAAALARIVETIGEELRVPWYAENPVSVLATLWRKPDHVFQPFEYGGYLPEDDIHPRWPEYILPRDAYPKRTCIWSGGGFVMPEKFPVAVADGWSLQQKKLGGKSAKTKRIRSETPRGWARAVFLYNAA
jgi:hypothetical protein